MYETLPNLVNTVGEAFIIENLSSYIINIDTNLAMNRHKNKNVHGFVKVFDFDIDFEKDTLTSVIYKLKNDITFGILDDKNEMIYFIKLFDKILSMNQCNIDFNKVDYFIITNAGKYELRFNIKNIDMAISIDTAISNAMSNTIIYNRKTISSIRRSMYLDIQSIRIGIIDNNITNNVNYYYNLINYGIKVCFGYYVFSTFVNTLYNPFWFIRDITKKLICS